MGFEYEISEIRQSLEKQALQFNNELILNPVENIPPQEILMPGISFLHGLYNSDKLRSEEDKKNTKIQFSNRDVIAEDINRIYRIWADVLDAEKISIRLFSGLHAHMIVFMSITKIGDTVLLLPEKAGGHMATRSILERLGLRIFEFAVDYDNMQIDIEKTKNIIDIVKPSVIFFDRSEGLVYEDLSWLKNYEDIYKIYDASQYLTNIIVKDYKNPFDMGFDAMISTLHKNLPGPQRALFCSKRDDKQWQLFNSQIGSYVSNMHAHVIYSAGLILEKFSTLKQLSSLMLQNTIKLDTILSDNGLHVIKRKSSQAEPSTHHIWIKFSDKEKAFEFYLKMEMLGISVNYRLLPYNLGYGIRIGLSAATVSGITPDNIETLGNIIVRASFEQITPALIKETTEYIHKVKSKNLFERDDAD